MPNEYTYWMWNKMKRIHFSHNINNYVNKRRIHPNLLGDIITLFLINQSYLILTNQFWVLQNFFLEKTTQNVDQILWLAVHDAPKLVPGKNNSGQEMIHAINNIDMGMCGAC